MVLSNTRNQVALNCYSNSRSYVQGKQSVLFQKIISLAIELMKNGQTAIETLNHIHVLTISQNEVEIKFEEQLPNYYEILGDKMALNTCDKMGKIILDILERMTAADMNARQII